MTADGSFLPSTVNIISFWEIQQKEFLKMFQTQRENISKITCIYSSKYATVLFMEGNYVELLLFDMIQADIIHKQFWGSIFFKNNKF